MSKINEIREACINIDISNIKNNLQVGILLNGEHITLETEKDIRLYYEGLSLKKLLSIYNQYNGLDYLKRDGEDLLEHGYGIDILELLEIL